eukprot:scaffold1397_cov254-Pinguiococcus_pyrenoidosus.AAC.66
MDPILLELLSQVPKGRGVVTGRLLSIVQDKRVLGSWCAGGKKRQTFEGDAARQRRRRFVGLSCRLLLPARRPKYAIAVREMSPALGICESLGFAISELPGMPAASRRAWVVSKISAAIAFDSRRRQALGEAP